MRRAYPSMGRAAGRRFRRRASPRPASRPGMVHPPRRRLAEDELGEAAAGVLRTNDRGTMTVAAPRLYPHQWSWDAAFVAIGLAHLSVPRACVELDSLLAAQWRTGMI